MVKACLQLYPLMLVGFIPNLWQGYLCGVVRALGIQSAVYKPMVIVYWFFNLPVSIILGFILKIGVSGLWVGIVLALWIVAAILEFQIYRVDWDVCCQEAKERLD